MNLLTRQSGAGPLWISKTISRLASSKARIQLGSEVSFDEVQKNFDFRCQTRANGVQSARHHWLWQPTRQDGPKPLDGSRFESHIQRQNRNACSIQHELSMHKRIVC